MQIVINGHTKDIAGTPTIKDIITQFSKSPTHLIAELNGNIIPTEKWPNTPLKSGDALELVAFVGGG